MLCSRVPFYETVNEWLFLKNEIKPTEQESPVLIIYCTQWLFLIFSVTIQMKSTNLGVHSR